MKIVITGGSGFLGSHLAAAAAGLGADVTVVDLLPPPAHLAAMPGVNWRSGDCHEMAGLGGILAGADVVCHFASRTNPAATWDRPELEYEAIVAPAVRIFQLCARSGVRKIVFPSSGGTVYGGQPVPANEDVLPAPVNPHGVAKLATEHLLRYLARQHAFACDIYRIANPYGPGQSARGSQGVVAIWMHQILRGETLKVFGDDATRRDYIHACDAAALMAHSFLQVDSSGTFNIGSGTGTSIVGLFRTIERVVGHPVAAEFGERRSFDAASSILDPGRICALRPGVRIRPLEEGLRSTWQELLAAQRDGSAG